MAEYLIQDTTLDAIVDAINAKTGGSSAMTPAEMVTAIGSISGGGLPSPIVALKTGSFTLSEDAASYTLTHNLGVVPQLVFVWCEGLTRRKNDQNKGKASMVVLSQVEDDDHAANWLYTVKYYHITSGNAMTVALTYAGGDVTATIAKIHTNASYPLGATLTTSGGTSPATWRWLAVAVSS